MSLTVGTECPLGNPSVGRSMRPPRGCAPLDEGMPFDAKRPDHQAMAVAAFTRAGDLVEGFARADRSRGTDWRRRVVIGAAEVLFESRHDDQDDVVSPVRSDHLHADR